jgi:hypothetical protein
MVPISVSAASPIFSFACVLRRAISWSAYYDHCRWQCLPSRGTGLHRPRPTTQGFKPQSILRTARRRHLISTWDTALPTSEKIARNGSGDGFVWASHILSSGLSETQLVVWLLLYRHRRRFLTRRTYLRWRKLSAKSRQPIYPTAANMTAFIIEGRAFLYGGGKQYLIGAAGQQSAPSVAGLKKWTFSNCLQRQ